MKQIFPRVNKKYEKIIIFKKVFLLRDTHKYDIVIAVALYYIKLHGIISGKPHIITYRIR